MNVNRILDFLDRNQTQSSNKYKGAEKLLVSYHKWHLKLSSQCKIHLLVQTNLIFTIYVLLSCSFFSPKANRLNLLSDIGDVPRASSWPGSGSFHRKRLSFLIALPIPMTSRSFLIALPIPMTSRSFLIDH